MHGRYFTILDPCIICVSNREILCCCHKEKRVVVVSLCKETFCALWTGKWATILARYNEILETQGASWKTKARFYKLITAIVTAMKMHTQRWEHTSPDLLQAEHLPLHKKSGSTRVNIKLYCLLEACQTYKAHIWFKMHSCFVYDLIVDALHRRNALTCLLFTEKEKESYFEKLP